MDERLTLRLSRIALQPGKGQVAGPGDRSIRVVLVRHARNRNGKFHGWIPSPYTVTQSGDRPRAGNGKSMAKAGIPLIRELWLVIFVPPFLGSLDTPELGTRSTSGRPGTLGRCGTRRTRVFPHRSHQRRIDSPLSRRRLSRDGAIVT
jgi:hypothetical protein